MHLLFLTIQNKNKKQKLSALHAIYGTFTIEISQNVTWFVVSNRTFFRKDHKINLFWNKESIAVLRWLSAISRNFLKIWLKKCGWKNLTKKCWHLDIAKFWSTLCEWEEKMVMFLSIFQKKITKNTICAKWCLSNKPSISLLKSTKLKSRLYKFLTISSKLFVVCKNVYMSYRLKKKLVLQLFILCLVLYDFIRFCFSFSSVANKWVLSNFILTLQLRGFFESIVFLCHVI